MKMKWIHKRKLFDPKVYRLENGFNEFAQSPQTVVFDDFVRIYFSTRKKSPISGKYLSFIAFIDVDKNFETILNASSQEVIQLGALGTFDEHGIFPINLLKEENRILAYTCGWSRRVSVSVETSIGLAISEDNGVTFKKHGHGPIMSSSINEPFLVGDAFVQKYDEVYHMWYIFGIRWMVATEMEPEARVYKIAHATSKDGIQWNKEEGIQIISDKLNENECQALPTVIKIDSRYHMYFCYREATDFRKNPKRSYKLGYAYSDNLLNWTRDDANSGISPTPGEWDSDMMCYPHLFECDSKVYLLHNGNEFGKFGFGISMLDISKNNEEIVYKTKTATSFDLSTHLDKCDNQFLSTLRKQVNIKEYAEKLCKYAVTFEAWNDSAELVGLIGVYLNDETSKMGFISNVSVLKEYSKKGIASQLLKYTKEYAVTNNFNMLSLEVNKKNKNAISLYKKNNFELLSETANILKMNYRLK